MSEEGLLSISNI